MADLLPSHYFSSAQRLFRQRWRDSGFPVRLTFAADGGARPNSGGTPFRQPCPAYPSTIGRKAPQERFSEESFRNCTSSGNAFLKSSAASSLPTWQENPQHTAAWMYSRNQTTIASRSEHRQPVFLHPTDGRIWS